MDFETKYGCLHSNQKLLIKELVKRGIEVEVINQELELISARYANHVETILDRDSSIMPYSTAVLVGDKMITKKFLKSVGISVPLGIEFSNYDNAFSLKESDYIIRAFNTFLGNGKSVVLKPVFGSHGENVHINIDSKYHLEIALSKIYHNLGPRRIIMEEYFEAKEYRVFLTKKGEYAVLNREPAYVIGSGLDSINTLVSKENDRRHALNTKTTILCPIRINDDDETETYLTKKGIDLNFVPKKDEKVYLRQNSNLASGGISIDVTDEVHESVIENCMKVFEAFSNLPYAGIDYMTNNITEKQDKNDYRIIEVNSNPGINMHKNPYIGKSRNLASPIVDLIFPETETEKVYEKKFKRII